MSGHGRLKTRYSLSRLRESLQFRSRPKAVDNVPETIPNLPTEIGMTTEPTERVGNLQSSHVDDHELHASGQFSQSIHLSENEPVRINVSGLSKPGCTEVFSEEILIGPSEEVYQLIDILRGRGYIDVCGFKGVSHGLPSVGPVAALDCDLPVEVVAGSSCYSLSKGLRINEDQTLIDFYDQFVSGPRLPASPMSFAICSDSIIGRDSRCGDAANGLQIKFYRTLRAPGDGKTYPLSTDFGKVKLLPVASLPTRLPPEMNASGGAVFPLYQREAVVVRFDRTVSGWMDPDAPPTFAIRAFEGQTNCITGNSEAIANKTSIQEHMVFPFQQRLDGCASRSGGVGQFVSMPLGSNNTSASQGPARVLRFQVAPRYPDGCNFTSGGRKMDIHSSPKQQGLTVGTTIRMGGSPQCQRKLKETAYSVSSPELFKNEDLYPLPKDRCRPTYIWELGSLTADGASRRPGMTWSVISVGSLSLSIDWLFFGLSGEKPTTALMSPFHNIESFRARIKSRIPQQIPRFDSHKLAINGKPLLEDPITRRIIQHGLGSDVSGGILSLAVESVETKVPQPTLSGGSRRPLTRWDVDLVAGGKAGIQVHADEDPKSWNWAASGFVTVHIMNLLAFEDITSITCPSTPIELSSYLTGRVPLITFERIGASSSSDVACIIHAGVVHQHGRQMACLVCEKNLCDSLLHACNHAFCRECILRHMDTGTLMTCAACRKETASVIRLSPPNTVRAIIQAPTSSSMGTEGQNASSSWTNGLSTTRPPGTISNPHPGPNKPASLSMVAYENAITFALDQTSYLADACGKGAEARVLDLLEHYGTVNQPPAEKGGRTALQAAAEGGHLKVVDILLRQGADVNGAAAPFDGMSALAAAADRGRVEVVKMLLAHGASVNAVLPGWRNYSSALQYACKAGHVEIIRSLLEAGAEMNKKEWGSVSPLCLAAEHGSPEAVRLLLEHGADVDNASSLTMDHGRPRGITPLHKATAKQHKEVVDILLKNGADPAIADAGKDTPLHIAAALADQAIFRLLLESPRIHKFAEMRDKYKAPLVQTMCKVGSFAMIEHFLDRVPNPCELFTLKCWAVFFYCGLGRTIPVGNVLGQNMNPNFSVSDDVTRLVGYQAETLLEHAVLNGRKEVVELLLKRGAVVPPSGTSGCLNEGPVLTAASKGFLDILKLLLANGAPFDEQMRSAAMQKAAKKGHVAVVDFIMGNHRHGTDKSELNKSLHQALTGGDAKTAHLLLGSGADANSEHEGKRPLHLAHFSAEMVELLLEHGADVGAEDRQKNLPLHQVARVRNKDAAEGLQLLLRAGSTVDQRNANHVTPLMTACAVHNVEVMKVLIFAGADARATDAEGRTPLHLCCTGNGDNAADQHEAIRLLASLLWVDVDAEDHKGRTALDLAALAFRSPVVRTLLGVGADPALVDLERLQHGIVVAHKQRATIYECEAVWQIRKATGETESLYGDELPVGFKLIRRLDNTDGPGSMKQISEDGEVNSFVFDMVVLNAVSSFKEL